VRCQFLVEKLKESSQLIDKKKSRDKRIEQLEQQLQDANRELSTSKMKSMFVIAITLISLFSFINSSFSGIVVARVSALPALNAKKRRKSVGCLLSVWLNDLLGTTVAFRAFFLGP